MLSPDVRVIGFSAEEWLRLGQIFRSNARVASPVAKASGGVVAVTGDGKLRKLLCTQRGRLELLDQPWPVPLSELAARHSASWALQLSARSLAELADRFADRLRREDTYLSQGLELLRVLRELESEGELSIHPWSVKDWPVPHERAVLRALDAVCPVGRVALLAVFSKGALFTAIAAHRGPAGIDALIGPSELAPGIGLLGGDWQRDYRHVAAATERALGPLALGCFGELGTFQALSTDPPAGAWAAAVAARDVLLSPAPPGAAIPLGLDAGRAVWSSVRGLAERLGATQWLGAERLRGPLERGTRLFEADLNAWLGFDPLKLLTLLLSRRSS